MTGIELIAKERQEQIEKHGRTVELDIIQNTDDQLMEAVRLLIEEDYQDYPPEGYNPKGWDSKSWYKMYSKPYHERLIIAGALIAAELDRLQGVPSK